MRRTLLQRVAGGDADEFCRERRMESKAKREGEAVAGGGEGTTAAAPIAAPLAAAAAGDAVAKPLQFHLQRPATSDVQQHAPIVPQAAAARQDVPAAAPLHSNQSQCKSCTDASARLEALQVSASASSGAAPA